MAATRLHGKTAIITGASSGIGRATALLFARNGARVALGARNLPALESLSGEIAGTGQEALVVACDVTRPEQVQRLVDETLTRWGKVDLLVSNAGEYVRSPIRELTIPMLERSMAVNFYGGVHAVLAVLPHMLARRSGHILLVNTMDVMVPLPPDTPYVAAKCALSGFGDVLRRELHGTGISVSSIYPARVETPMIARLQVPWLTAKIPAEEVARAILGAVQRPRAKVIVLPWQSKPMHLLSYFIPLSLTDRLIRVFRLEGWEA